MINDTYSAPLPVQVLPQALIGESLARAGFEISLKFPCVFLRLHRHVGFQRDGQVGLRLIDVAPLMRSDPTPEVVRRTYVDVTVFQLEEIDIPHVKSPFAPAELRKTLLRLIAFGNQSIAWPATRSRRRRVAEGESADITCHYV